MMVGWGGLGGLLSLWMPMIQRGQVVWPELMTNLRGLVYMTLHLGGLTDATNALTLGLSILTLCYHFAAVAAKRRRTA